VKVRCSLSPEPFSTNSLGWRENDARSGANLRLPELDMISAGCVSINVLEAMPESFAISVPQKSNDPTHVSRRIDIETKAGALLFRGGSMNTQEALSLLPATN